MLISAKRNYSVTNYFATNRIACSTKDFVSKFGTDGYLILQFVE